MQESKNFENIMTPVDKEMENNEVSESEKEDLDRQLTPEEAKKELSKLKTEYSTELREKTGIDVIFPKGAKIGEIDISGKTLGEILDMVIDPLESYEPPIIQEQIETTIEQKEEDIPNWLKDHKELIWTGAYENPIWKIKGEQSGKEVTVSYIRELRELKPGKTKEEQLRTLEAVENSFTLDEWKIIKQVFDEYEKLEENTQSDNKETKKQAKKQILEILKEENAFRLGKGEIPKILNNRIHEIVEDIAKKTRGFKKENIDEDALTQKTEEILSQIVVLNYTRGEGKERIPKLKSDIKEIPSFEYSLSELSRCLGTQLENKKGISLMIGEAGTGKNEAVEYLAAKTNRPYYWFPCGRGMEGMDLVQHYEFDSKEGTKRFLTDLAEGIQTPGSVVMIDEINALKPEVQAILHGLGDSNRSLNYDGVRIPVAEGVVIVIAGNPATYGAAGDIGEALLSRTSGQSMIMDYPALKKGELMQRKEKWSDSLILQTCI